MWIYSQKSGDLSIKDKSIGVCYSGHGEGLNNPELQEVHDVGPIPRGRYTIGPAFTHPTAGPMTMRLIPQAGTNTFGRDGFLMHGDSVSMDHTASHGCIVANRTIRATVATSDDRTLDVV